MSKKLISLALAILLVVGLTSAFLITASANDPLVPEINFQKETIKVPVPAGTDFLLYALGSAPQNTTDQRVLSRERWTVARVANGFAEIDISRVIPKRVPKNPYTIAFKLPANDASRTVIEIPARQQNRVPAVTGSAEINVGKLRNGVGIVFLFDNEFTRIINLTGTEVDIQFAADSNFAKLTKSSYSLTTGESNGDGSDRIVIPNNLLTRSLPFTVRIAARVATESSLSSFGSQPVRLTVPAQPRAPSVRHTVAKTDTNGGTINVRDGRINAKDGTIRTGFPQARLNSDATWTSLTAEGARTPLSTVLQQLGVPKTATIAATETSIIYYRTGHTAKAGASAVLEIKISGDNWNAALAAMTETVTGTGTTAFGITANQPCAHCEKTPCQCCTCTAVCDSCEGCKEAKCCGLAECKCVRCKCAGLCVDRCADCGQCLKCSKCECVDP